MVDDLALGPRNFAGWVSSGGCFGFLWCWLGMGGFCFDVLLGETLLEV